MEPVLSTSSAGRAILVNRYAMPFAVLTVSLGVALGSPEGMVGNLSIGLLIFGSVFNVASGRYLAASTSPSFGFIQMRLWINLICNALIAWLLGGYWTPAWLLLALTPIAAAVYLSKKGTLAIACAVGAFILVRYGVRGSGSPLEWGEQICYAAFVVLSSLMVYALTHESAPTPAA